MTKDQLASGMYSSKEHCSGCAMPSDPILLVEREHALQNELCNLLEEIADSLPHEASPMLAELACKFLAQSFTGHIVFEEQVFFPAIRARVSGSDTLNVVLGQLETENAHSEASVIEIIDALSEVAEGAIPANVEAFAYLLRGFFESQRRHLSWENEILLPAARQVLTDVELASIKNWIIENDHPCCRKQCFNLIRSVRRAAHNKHSGACSPRHH